MSNNEKYFKAIELLSEWSYENAGFKLGIMSMGATGWELVWEIVPQQPPPQQVQPQVQPQVQVQAVQGTPVILEAPPRRRKTWTKKGGKTTAKANKDDKYEEFVRVVREKLVMISGATIRSCELTEEVNKHLTFKMTNNSMTPQYMNRFMEENKSVTKKAGKTGVIYMGIGRVGLEKVEEVQPKPEPVKLNLKMPKLGRTKVKEERECEYCTDKTCEECQMKEEKELETEIQHAIDYSTLNGYRDVKWTSGYSMAENNRIR